MYQSCAGDLLAEILRSYEYGDCTSKFFCVVWTVRRNIWWGCRPSIILQIRRRKGDAASFLLKYLLQDCFVYRMFSWMKNAKLNNLLIEIPCQGRLLSQSFLHAMWSAIFGQAAGRVQYWMSEVRNDPLQHILLIFVSRHVPYNVFREVKNSIF